MKTTNKIPKYLKLKYRIKNDREEVRINDPAFITITKDSKYDVKLDEYSLTIKNSKVSVDLWINVNNMHVTIY